jgi:hypothetical protein
MLHCVLRNTACAFESVGIALHKPVQQDHSAEVHRREFDHLSHRFGQNNNPTQLF